MEGALAQKKTIYSEFTSKTLISIHSRCIMTSAGFDLVGHVINYQTFYKTKLTTEAQSEHGALPSA